MKLYTAAIYTNGLGIGGKYYQRMTPEEQKHRDGIRYILESYHYVNSQPKVDAMRKDGVKVFLDSGAFSAYTQNVTINLDKYCEYIKTNSNIVDFASVLDSVGDPARTYSNQRDMERNGCAALPCYHYGEPEHYLTRYIDSYAYITIGGMVPISKPQLRLWLDRIWSNYLCDNTGRARVKVHAFGMTNLELMARYPWYSVDSSSWVQIGSMGNILVPGLGTVAISDTSPRIKEEGQHAQNLTNPQRWALRELVTKRGFTWERLQKEYVSRWMFNCAVYKEINLELEQKELIFKTDQMGIF